MFLSANLIQAERVHLKGKKLRQTGNEVTGGSWAWGPIPDKALSKGKAEPDRESSRQKFDTRLQWDLAKRHIKKE